MERQMADEDTTTTKPRARKTAEALPQLTALPERVGVLEAKLEYTNEKLDDLKADVKDMHDCLDRTRDTVTEKLDNMMEEYSRNRDKFYEHADVLHKENTAQHTVLMGKVTELEKFKNKWTMYVMLLLAFGAGTGWVGHIDFKTLLKLLGL
jgi:chromosome segregation ATPase